MGINGIEAIKVVFYWVTDAQGCDIKLKKKVGKVCDRLISRLTFMFTFLSFFSKEFCPILLCFSKKQQQLNVNETKPSTGRKLSFPKGTKT